MKISEATGEDLDWAVLVALHGKHDVTNPEHVAHFREIRSAHILHQQGHYSTNWSQGGPIIVQERLQISPEGDGLDVNLWRAVKYDHLFDEGKEACQFGPTPLVAAMRSFVVSRLGEDVDVPSEIDGAAAMPRQQQREAQ